MMAKQGGGLEADCGKITRTKPDMTVTEEIAREIGSNYRTLPAFEKGLFDHVYIKHFSLERNEYLRCRWKEYKEEFENRIFQPFQFPSHRDLHFHNGCVRFKPTESLHRRTDYRNGLKPGPGVDTYGQVPIPQELLMKRGKIVKDAVKLPRNKMEVARKV